jgi:cell division initiation protein
MTQGSGPGSADAAGAKITPLDIQQKEFRVSRLGGYRMRDVDEFLDQLTEVVSGLVDENARLRRQAGAQPVVGAPDLDDVARQADEIIQRARDEAARIAADARSGSSAAGTRAADTDEDRAAVKAFLRQERAFLQDLAGLVQDHAETVKGMAKGARRDAGDAVVASAAEQPVATEASDGPVPDAGEEAPPAEAPEDEVATDQVVQIVEVEMETEATQTLAPNEDRTELAQTRPSGGAPDRGSAGDASLRELFWGEDA